MTEEHTLVALVEDKPGVLNRVASLFRRRNFNIDSLTVGHTNVPGVSRMTIVVGAEQRQAHLVEANLNKLVNVISVRDVTNDRTVTRDLALIKVRADASARAEISQLTEIFRARIVDVSRTPSSWRSRERRRRSTRWWICCGPSASSRWCAPVAWPWCVGMRASPQ